VVTSAVNKGEQRRQFFTGRRLFFHCARRIGWRCGGEMKLWG